MESSNYQNSLSRKLTHLKSILEIDFYSPFPLSNAGLTKLFKKVVLRKNNSMTREQRLRFNPLEARYPEIFKIVEAWTLKELKNKFVKKGKFICYKNDIISVHKLANFNIAVAEVALNEKWITKTERRRQNCIYAYRISWWTQKLLKKYRIVHLGQAIEKCVNKDGSFRPLGGKDARVSSNYQIASILRKENFISEKKFLKVRRPTWKYRRLTEEELGEAKDIIINISKWPSDTVKIISILYKRRNNLSWDRYLHPVPTKETVTLGFLAEEFLRIPSYDDMPVFKKKGHRLQKSFGVLWTDTTIEEALEIVEKTFRENNLLL